MLRLCQADEMDVYRTRRANLRALAQQWGGPTSLAKKLGHSNGSYLAQLIGPNPSREVSEKTAREIEKRLGLPVAWMDQENPASAQPDDSQLAECVKAVATCLRDAGLRPGPETYSQVVALVYDRLRLTGRVDEPYIQRLLALMGGK
jgi:hypothetical protein